MEQNRRGVAYDRTGKRYGHLVVVKRAEDFIYSQGTHESQWLCICDCGNYTIAKASRLTSGEKKSCGCGIARGTHKQSSTRIYKIWLSMKHRCGNEKDKHYKYYGGRGIRVCDEWEQSFEAFYEWAMANGYNENLSIDRIDVDKDYSPANCRWATWEEQANNKRNNVVVTYNGKTQTMAQWAKETGIGYQTLLYRYRKGKRGESLFAMPR